MATHEKCPLIGLTTYPNDPAGEAFRAHGFHTPTPYTDAVWRAGGVPVLLPHIGVESVPVWIKALDGLIVVGGGDIEPSLYGSKGHETIYNTSPQRDEIEIALVKAAIAHHLPSLLICRGLQVLNVALGGSLHVHIPDVFGEKVLHRAPPREPVEHDVILQEDAYLANVLPLRSRSVSWHHQAVDRLGEGLKVVGWAEDGVIEAIELEGHEEITAVQWHPEMSADRDPIQQALFNTLIQRARGT